MLAVCEKLMKVLSWQKEEGGSLGSRQKNQLSNVKGSVAVGTG